MSGHAPTPWLLYEGEDQRDAPFSNGRTIMVPLSEGPELGHRAVAYTDFNLESEARANAAFILECVNSHAALVAERDALRKALEAVEEWWLSEGMKHFTGAPYAMFAARAALSPEHQREEGK